MRRAVFEYTTAYNKEEGSKKAKEILGNALKKDPIGNANVAENFERQIEKPYIVQALGMPESLFIKSKEAPQKSFIEKLKGYLEKAKRINEKIQESGKKR